MSVRQKQVRAALVALLLGTSLGCSANSAKNRYILAEKLWTDGKYSAAVGEFEKVIARDPKGKLGLQALYRAALTQSLYLSQHVDAVKKFRTYVELSGDSAGAWEAQKLIGEILYSKTEQYDQAIQHYRGMLKAKPQAPEAAEFQFRIGKSHFFNWQFDQAIAVYQELEKKHPNTPWAEKAAFEIGVTHFTRAGSQGTEQALTAETYQEAMDAYKDFLVRFPDSQHAAEARFGIASCLEEMDQLDAAYHQYEALRSTYPSPNVIEIKLVRIRQRKTQRSQ